MKTVLVSLGLIVTLPWVDSGVAADLDSALATLQGKFEEQQLEIAAPGDELRQKYLAHLKKARVKLQASGEQEAVSALDDELKNPGHSQEVGRSAILLKAQTIYVEQQSKIAAVERDKLVLLAQHYHRNLELLQTKLARASRFDAARLARAETLRAADLVKEWTAIASHMALGEETLQPTEIRNEMPGGGNDNRPTYIIESDGTKGTLFLSFKHDLLVSTSYSLKSAILELEVSSDRASDTSETISIHAGEERDAVVLGAQEGAAKEEVVAIPIDLTKLPKMEAIELTVRCGTNALILKKGDNGPRLKVKFRQ